MNQKRLEKDCYVVGFGKQSVVIINITKYTYSICIYSLNLKSHSWFFISWHKGTSMWRYAQDAYFNVHSDQKKKKRKQSKCPSVRDWLNEQGYSCTKNNLIHNSIFFIQSINECFSAILLDTENVVLVTMSEKKRKQNRMHNMIQFYF